MNHSDTLRALLRADIDTSDTRHGILSADEVAAIKTGIVRIESIHAGGIHPLFADTGTQEGADL